MKAATLSVAQGEVKIDRRWQRLLLGRIGAT